MSEAFPEGVLRVPGPWLPALSFSSHHPPLSPTLTPAPAGAAPYTHVCTHRPAQTQHLSHSVVAWGAQGPR